MVLLSLSACELVSCKVSLNPSATKHKRDYFVLDLTYICNILIDLMRQ